MQTINKVLLIDDDPINNFVNKKLILKLNKNYQIDEFTDAAQAFEYLKTNTPEIIFLDLAMPDLDGWQFLELYKHNNYTSPIFILTTSINPNDRIKSESYDFVQGFFIKPLSVLETQVIFP